MSLKIAFIQESGKTQHGIMILSAVLKEHHFSTEVFSMEIEGEPIIDEVSKYKPDIIGCTMMTPGYKEMMRLLNDLKITIPKAFIIAGGPHPTFYPNIIEQTNIIDAICIGEGEYALLELASSLKSGNVDPKINNLWIRLNGKIYKNEKRDLIKDLDSLPFSDRDIYFKKYSHLAEGDIKFNIGRGCPFDCSYCFNKGMKDMYKGQGSWVRFRSIENIIQEIKNVDEKYPIKWLNFNDDTFNINKKWLKEFLKILKKEINIPFLCQLRIDCADEEQIELLKQAGVDKITVGIEHGDENLRKKLLKRNISNKQILDFGKWINKRKIRLHTTNIMGFPRETLDMAFSTIELNAKLKPELAVSNILNPYPGTDIYQYVKDHGYLHEGFSFNEMTGQNVWSVNTKSIKSEIKNEYMPLMINLRCFFMLLVFYPQLKPLVKIMIKLPNNFFYEFLWRVTSYFRIDWKYANSWKERWNLLIKLLS